MSVWMVRAGHGGIYAQLWRESGIVGIRWTFGDRDVRGMNYEQLRDAHSLAHPKESAASVSSAASQVHHFLTDMTDNTRVVTYDPAAREYLIGRVTGTGTSPTMTKCRTCVASSGTVLRAAMPCPQTRAHASAVERRFSASPKTLRASSPVRPVSRGGKGRPTLTIRTSMTPQPSRSPRRDSGGWPRR